jgi:diguanylate cyclase (GGDEF)-like protein
MSQACDVDRLVKPLDSVITIGAAESVQAAIARMCQHGIGCLVVLDGEGAVAGILTERDILTRAAALSADFSSTPVAEIATPKVICCEPETLASKAHSLMVEHGVRHLPIVEDGRLVGMTSSRDVMAYELRVLASRNAVVEQIAALIKCLKTLDLNEVCDVLTHEVPKFYGARRAVLRLPPSAGPIAGHCLVRREDCPCPEEGFPDQAAADPDGDRGPLPGPDVPPICKGLGAHPPRLVIPLSVATAGAAARGSGGGDGSCLCMCGLRPSRLQIEEVFTHATNLLRDLFSTSLTNAVLYQRARIDPLTHTATRRVLEERLQSEYDRAVRYGSTFSIALFDVDDLKAVNDRSGHPAGDRVLAGVGQILRRSARLTDLVARYGGDEFVLLLPHTGAPDTANTVERIRERVAELQPAPGVTATVSCGATAWLGTHEDTPERMLQRADAALYQAKRAGRNTCVVSQTGDPAAPGRAAGPARRRRRRGPKGPTK